MPVPSLDREVHVPNTVTAKLVHRLLPRPQPPHAPPSRREEALAVLSATRGVIARGWTQHSWYEIETPTGRRPAAQRFFPWRVDRRNVVSACLVGAVMHGGWLLSPRPEYAYPAIDALWHTLFDTGTDLGPAAPPLVRAARVRDLTTWNDRNHRTRQDVLRLVDRATARLAAASPVRT
jgi:hypothetical protein